MDLPTLKNRRTQIKKKNTRMSTFMADIETRPSKLKQLAARMETYRQVLTEFEEVQQGIEILDATELDGDERDSFEDIYFENLAKGNELLEATIPANASAVSYAPSNVSETRSTTTQLNVKLPTIELPSFSGDYSEWLAFRDIFESMIHGNEQLNDVQRLHYLKSSLKDCAAQVIAALPTIATNYNIAWTMIRERYENSRILIKTHVERLLDLPSIQRESAKALRELLDAILRNVRALKSMGKPTDEWGTLLIYIIVRKLDPISRRAWEMKDPSAEDPSFKALEDFLRERAQMLENIETRVEPERTRKQLRALVVHRPQCPDCSRNHRIFTCETFAARSQPQRLARVKQLKLCINCLQGNHTIYDCKSSNCRKCNKRHHTLLHSESGKTVADNEGPASREQPSITPTEQVSLTSVICTQHVLLSTAILVVTASTGQLYEARALLDSGSQASFITQNLHDKLGTPTKRQTITIMGIGGSGKDLNSSTWLKLHSRQNEFKFDVNCFIIPKITNDLPTSTLHPHELRIPPNICLADPTFYRPSQIDILLGADVFYKLLSVGQIKLGPRMPILQKTILGWVISGTFNSPQARSSIACNFSQGLDDQVAKFWALEDIPLEKIATATEVLCEEHFLRTHKQNTDGRFMVKIPMRDESFDLGDSYTTALKRLHSMERKFTNDPNLQKQYSNFMSEYEDLNHMTLIERPNNDQGYYLPHHAVTNESSITTKLRVVFDASAPTTTGKSLNDLQHAGPQLQDDLLHIILRFRIHAYVMTADISKMYRQVLIDPEQRKYQKILWRLSPEEPVKTYQLNTVTYGMKASSFLAIRCLHELARKFSAEYPMAASKIIEDFYVDDLITGENNLESLIQRKSEIDLILKSGCFELRKWSSNHNQILSSNNSADTPYEIHPEAAQKTLGLIWTPAADVLQCAIHQPISNSQITKRSILSITSQIFDPLGLVAPVVIIAKLLIQSLWQLQLPWDASVPQPMHTQWMTFYEQLILLKDLSVPRRVIAENTSIIELHGFADASERAYGACIYLRSSNPTGEVQVKLLCARSRVAPLKQLSIPRLELCAAVLLVDLFKKVQGALNIQFHNCYFWSDSTITLAWIRSEPRRWKTFVCNRVAKIQRHTNPDTWHHVASEDNPSDLISRGSLPEVLLSSNLWWHGPDWLMLDAEKWPQVTGRDDETLLEERSTPTLSMVTAVEEDDPIISNFSTLNRLQRITAMCIRFAHNARNPGSKITGALTTSELDVALKRLIKLVQSRHFKEDLAHLSNHATARPQGALRQMNPFIDNEGLLRVGGRLHNAYLPYDQRHPFILPSKGHFVTLLVKAQHHKMLHAGPQSVLSALRLRFWILAARNLVRSILRKCITCYRVRPTPLCQIMGNLPAERCQESLPFTISGIDFGGPMKIVESHRRGNAKLIRKCYIAVFVCFSTKAVHLDLVSDLTSEAFITCLRRFIARRGNCKYIYSDNATKFVGADNELHRLV